MRRIAYARLRREDHLGDPALPLKQAVAEHLAGHGLRLNGPVRLLTQLRILGYVSNPVSFYFCFAADGETLEHVIAEVTNTPWGERHCYVMSQPRRRGPTHTFDFAKTFHVSPFMPMDMHYTWRFSQPGKRMLVHCNSHRGGDKLFDATLTLQRRPLTGPQLAAALIRQPLMSFKTTALIYWQAARLWFKRVPFVPHPAKVPPSQARSHD